MLGEKYFNKSFKEDTHLLICQPLKKDFFW